MIPRQSFETHGLVFGFQGSWRSQLEYSQCNDKGGGNKRGGHILKRTIKRSKSVVDVMLFGSKL